MGTRAWWSVRRRRRASRHDVGAAAFVLLTLAIAAVSVDLLVLAAAAFVAWLLRLASRPHADIVAEPPPARALDAPYRPVMEVDPAVFKDTAASNAVSRRAFDAWVRGLPRAPRYTIDLVRSVDTRVRNVGRLTTELETRRVVERCEPALGHEPASSPPFVRQHIDPWDPPADLPRASRFLTPCWTCNAAGRVECTACRGTARRTCTSCDGAGKYYGVTANGARRMLNCKTCRGKRTVVCSDCTRGKIECATCRQATKLACWLEVRSELRHDLQLGPDPASLQPFSWSQPGVRAADDQLARDAHIVDTITKPRLLAPGDLPATVPADLRGDRAPRLQARLAPDERVRSQTLTILAVPSVSVTYAVGGEQHTVAFEGFRMLAPPNTAPAAEPFLRRSRMLGRARLALAALPALAVLLYAARGEYFASGRGAGLAVGVDVFAMITAGCAYAALWSASLGRRRARTWAIATIVPVAFATLLAAAAEPRLARARDLVAAGQLDAAAAELRALALPPTDDAWAALQLRRSLAAPTCVEATAALRDLRLELPPRAEAQAHADQLALSEAQAAVHAGDPDRASTALSCSSDAGRAAPAARTLRAQLADLQTRRCLDAKDWRCALEHSAASTDPAALRAQTLTAIRTEADTLAASASRAPSLEHRVQQAQAALDLWQTYLLDPQPSAAPPRPLTDLRAALARDRPALATQQRIAQARAEAEARRQAAAAERERKPAVLAAERERKRAELAAERERRRQAAEEARANRSTGRLLCNDGTLSPTCTCAGSHRGCCSWHGGVAGCE